MNERSEITQLSTDSISWRKKPVVIQAMRVTPSPGDNDALVEFLSPCDDWVMMEDYVTIGTLEGDMRANIGDWIIKGVKGEYYPCKNDIFEATYEPA